MKAETRHVLFYNGWPGQGLKGVFTSDERARDAIDELVERGTSGGGRLYRSELFSVMALPLNSVEVGGQMVPIRDKAALVSGVGS
jgi:hypothetical protein